MSVMEYAARFNELSRFAPHQVATKEMKMDHFEQGLKGPIKRMIAGHVFTSFQEMYKRAVKIALVIEETKAEGRQMGLAKRKFSQGGSSTQGNKRFRNFNPAKDRGKGVHVAARQEIEPCNQCGRLHYGLCKYGTQGCYGCGAMDHKLADCPRKARNHQGHIPSSGTGTNLSLREAALPQIQPREATEVEKGRRQVAGCLA